MLLFNLSPTMAHRMWCLVSTHMLKRPPLWSSGQSSWLQIQRSGFHSRRYQILWEVVGLEWGPLSFVNTTEELLERINSGSCIKKPRLRPQGSFTLTMRHPLCAKVGTKFANKRRSLGGYSSLADWGHTVKEHAWRSTSLGPTKGVQRKCYVNRQTEAYIDVRSIDYKQLELQNGEVCCERCRLRNVLIMSIFAATEDTSIHSVGKTHCFLKLEQVTYMYILHIVSYYKYYTY
jgi:hypothetical protein